MIIRLQWDKISEGKWQGKNTNYFVEHVGGQVFKALLIVEGKRYLLGKKINCLSARQCCEGHAMLKARAAQCS